MAISVNSGVSYGQPAGSGDRNCSATRCFDSLFVICAEMDKGIPYVIAQEGVIRNLRCASGQGQRETQ
jgi:hypothetical protein